MINKIIEFSAKRKFLVFLLVGAAVLFGWQSMKNTKLDAIPDLSDTQVIVYAKWDRSPDIMEDQVTYPITSALLGMPKVKDIRGFSDFGYSYIYIIFDEGTDIYWARSRTLEYLNSVTPRLPKGVNVELAKDATAVGWVYRVRAGGCHWTVQPGTDAQLPGLVSALCAAIRSRRGGGRSGRRLCPRVPGQRRSQQAAGLQDSDRHGGQRHSERQQRCRRATGGDHRPRVHGARTRVHQVARTTFEDIVVMYNPQTGTPVLVRDVATVVYGPDMRRGVVELDGRGEAVGGVVIMRFGENAEKTIERVKAKLADIEPTLAQRPEDRHHLRSVRADRQRYRQP